MKTIEVFQAIRAADPHACIKLTRTGDPQWYVSTTLEAARDGMLYGIQGFASQLKHCVHKAWAEITEEPAIVRVNANRRLHWNGFMWEECELKEDEEAAGG